MKTDKIKNTLVEQHLAKICEEKSFAKSPRYIELLTFLIDQSKANNSLKEQTIGLELFKESYEDGKSDGIVRVYMYNLRKKLADYYASEGKTDTIVFSLKKGSYDLKILPRKESKFGSTARTISLKAQAYLALVLLFSMAGFLIYKYYPQEHYCWEPFFKSGKVNTCIMADQVILLHSEGGSGVLFTKPEVNSTQEFISYSKQSTDSLELAGYTLFTKAIPFSINKLSRWFSEHQQSFSTKPESDFSFEDTKTGNIIYIGQYKTMSVSKELFLRNSTQFEADYNHFIYTKNGQRTVFKTTYGESVKVEYAMASFMPISDGHHALYFVSNHDIGTMATVNYFTNPDFLRSFYSGLPSTDAYFNALFKVEGVNRSDISCELVELEILEY